MTYFLASNAEEEFMRTIAKDLIPILAITLGSIIAMIAIIFSLVRSMVVTKAREHTKRELAAYVAEGTLDPDKAVAMIEADKPHWEKDS